MKQQTVFWLMTGTAIIVGFTVGYGVGQGTREAMPSKVSTTVNDGVVTIKADLGGAVKEGALNWLTTL